MKELFKNWNYAKHACAVTGIYALISVTGNLMMGTPRKVRNAGLTHPGYCIKKLSKREKTFNAAVLACYVFDMTATFGVIKLLQKKLFK